MTYFALGWRNLKRNLRRTIVTGLSITCGFAAIVLFAGYAQTAYRGLSDQAIYGELLGHLTVTKMGFRTTGQIDPESYLFSADEIERVITLVRDGSKEAHIAPRLLISGMLGNNRASTIFIAEGVDPEDMAVLRGPRRRASGALEVNEKQGVTLASGLADMLGLAYDSHAVALVSTQYGQANAIDVSVRDIFDTGNAGTNDKLMFIPLELARILYDAPGAADRLTILLSGAQDVAEVSEYLETVFTTKGLNLKVETWQDQSAFYHQVRSMFDMIFRFILAIVLTIVILSVANAMAMNVVERTREIGTLRAVGMRRASLIRLFCTEAFLLIGLSCLLGLLIALCVRYSVNLAEITYQPPNTTGHVPLLIGFDLNKTIMVVGMMTVLGMLSTLIPASRAARQHIIDALGHV